MHLCQLSRIIRESPGYGTNLPVSRTGGPISQIKSTLGLWIFSDLFSNINCKIIAQIYPKSKRLWFHVAVPGYIFRISCIFHSIWYSWVISESCRHCGPILFVRGGSFFGKGGWVNEGGWQKRKNLQILDLQRLASLPMHTKPKYEILLH